MAVRRNVTLRMQGKIEVDPKAALDVAAAVVPGEILRQNNRSVDADGSTFKPYSASYAARLRKMGESTRVDHRVTGGLLGSVGERWRKVAWTGGQLGIGPSAAYAVIGAALQRLRKWLGLAPEGRKRLAKALEKARIFKGRSK